LEEGKTNVSSAEENATVSTFFNILSKTAENSCHEGIVGSLTSMNTNTPLA
jgi:hypothetical protein